MDCELVSHHYFGSQSYCSTHPNSSKDTKIRVWNRETLNLHRTLTGHEGPVNAIGLQNGFIVSASGDTKMMLWDIEHGTCLRTFDGHDRGLACIEFKVLLSSLKRSVRPADVLSTDNNRITTSCPGQVTVQSRYGMRRQASVYAPSLDTTRLCVPLPLTLLLDALSVQAMIRLSRYGTSGLGARCSNLSITTLGIFLTSSLIYIGSLGACCVCTIHMPAGDADYTCARSSTSHDRRIVVLDFTQNLDTALFT